MWASIKKIPLKWAYILSGLHGAYVAIIVLTWLSGIGFQNDEAWIIAFVPFNLGILITGDLPAFLTSEQSRLVWAAYLLVSGSIQWGAIGFIAATVSRQMVDPNR